MSKKPEISADDQTLFRQAVADVKRITQRKTITPLPPKSSPRKKKSVDEPEKSYALFSDFEKVAPVTGEDMVEYCKPGLQHKSLRKLRSGQYNVEAILDLHGKTAAEAKESLHHFLLRCQRDKTRHILIIHGKGRSNTHPVLKNKLNNWLRQIDQIVAFCSATAKDGQSGAMYVLLKNQKGEKAF